MSVEEFVCIPRQQTAKLSTVKGRNGHGPEVVVLKCPSCPDRENSRLVQVELARETLESRRRKAGLERMAPPLRMLLHITRDEVSQILRELDGGPVNGSGNPSSTNGSD
jgi:hypothetical protein